MKDHVCKPMEPYCRCYQLADEPSERCPIHGGAPRENRCECGRFVKRNVRQQLGEVAGRKGLR